MSIPLLSHCYSRAASEHLSQLQTSSEQNVTSATKNSWYSQVLVTFKAFWAKVEEHCCTSLRWQLHCADSIHRKTFIALKSGFENPCPTPTHNVTQFHQTHCFKGIKSKPGILKLGSLYMPQALVKKDKKRKGRKKNKTRKTSVPYCV